MREDYVILCDMDEVLVDFTSAACLVHGITREQMEAERTASSLGIWNLEGPIGFAKGLGRALTLDEFWEPIHEGGERFWAELKPLLWHEEIVGLLSVGSSRLKYRPKRPSDVNEDWHIVSGPSKLACSYSGKVKWLKGYFGERFDRFAITPHKELFARDNRVLIDDREQNCSKFIETGGKAILFPSRGNALYAYADDPVPYVRHCLNQL